jgi:penicillin amidase
MLKVIGNSGYDLGARARQIRDDLAALSNVTPADLLKVQLDDRAVFLARWRDLLLAGLTPAATAGHPRRLELRTAVEAWGGRASVDSVGYRMVRTFRQSLSRAVLRPLTAACLTADARFSAGLQTEGPVWAILTARPPHLLNPAYKSWDEQVLAAVDDVLDQFTDGPLSAHSWGERNTVRIEHPVAGGLPVIGGWFSMPREPLPGDSNMPRFQAVSAGASERMVVSPGHEGEGLFHMPAGQCGNPLSAHFGDGHEAWARGKPTPFLPGPTVHTLTLVPGAR